MSAEVPTPSKSPGGRWRRLAPFFAAGPISGPLLAGAVLNFRNGHPVLASLYAVALALFTLLLPAIAVRILPGQV